MCVFEVLGPFAISFDNVCKAASRIKNFALHFVGGCKFLIWRGFFVRARSATASIFSTIFGIACAVPKFVLVFWGGSSVFNLAMNFCLGLFYSSMGFIDFFGVAFGRHTFC